MKTSLIAIFGIVVLFGFEIALAQDRLAKTLGLPAASVAPLENSARVQIDRAEALLRNGAYDELLEAFRRVIDTHGDRIIELPAPNGVGPAGFNRFISVRDRAWMRLAKLHRVAPEILGSFRRQIDPQARRWFEQSDGNRDGRDQRIVDELFLSTLADDALLRLGDFALERGEYNSARRYWERIAPGLRFVSNNHEQLRSASNRPLWLPFVGVDVAKAWPVVEPLFSDPHDLTEVVYPDTDLDVAEVRARLAVVSIMERNFERAEIEIDILERIAPDASGTIAGRNGKLVELTRETLAEARNWASTKEPKDWLTFAGSGARSRVADSIVQLSEKPLWSVRLPHWRVENEVLTFHRVRVAEDADALLPYHPLVVGDKAIVQTQPFRSHVHAFDLETGELALPKVEGTLSQFDLHDQRNVFGVPRFAPTADGTTVFLLAGLPTLSAGEDRRRSTTKLEAIDIAAERKLLWEFSPESSDLPPHVSLAGPPVCDGSRLFIALRKREAARDETHIAALDQRDGRLLWKQFIGAAEPSTNPTWTELTQNILTVDQGTVYCNTNAGLVAALDSRSGRVHWISSYPRSGWHEANLDRNDLHFYRDLNPCLVYRDVLVIAPTDCNRIFALDVVTGIPLWVSPAELGADAVHLIGVVDNRLVVSGECVYWFDIRNGELLGRYPEPFKAGPGFARPSPRGYGRGILVGDHLYWPTRDAILIFDQANSAAEGTWHPAIESNIDLSEHEATGGNLILANETLLIAGADRLIAFMARNAREQ